MKKCKREKPLGILNLVWMEGKNNIPSAVRFGVDEVSHKDRQMGWQRVLSADIPFTLCVDISLSAKSSVDLAEHKT